MISYIIIECEFYTLQLYLPSYYPGYPSCGIIIDCMKLIQPAHFQPFLILLFLHFGKNEDMHSDSPKCVSEWFYLLFFAYIFFFWSFWQFLCGSLVSLLIVFYMYALFSFSLKWPNYSQHSVSYRSYRCISLVAFCLPMYFPCCM